MVWDCYNGRFTKIRYVNKCRVSDRELEVESGPRGWWWWYDRNEGKDTRVSGKG